MAQIQINYLDTKLRDAGDCYNLLTEHGIPVFVMEPIKGGALANVPESVANLFQSVTPTYSPPPGRSAGLPACPM